MASPLQDQLQAALGRAYTLERELGGGGMSRVFVAEEARLGRKVVIKVLAPELTAGLNVERFEREIRLAASLQQANIVPVLSAGGADDGMPYYTMPFVEGESLRARLSRDGALSIGEITGILRDVARALAYAHQHGVVHRDIKPDNVLLSGGTAVVTDFGIAKALSASRVTEAEGTALTQMGTAIGTPAYMAPEQVAGDPDVDHRADIYALGCMAYELLTGQTPFADRTPQRVLAAHLSETPRPVSELRPDVPPALAELTMHCLAKDPAERPQSAAEIGQRLAAIESSGGMPAQTARAPIGIGRALLIYAALFAGVAVLARAAIIVVGLPDWVFTGAIALMALGLPLVVMAGVSQRIAGRVARSTPAGISSGERIAATRSGSSAARTSSVGPTAASGTVQRLALEVAPVVTWERIAKAGVAALATFAILVGAFMVLRSLGIGPAGSLLGAGKLQDKDRVLVTDFRAGGADSSLARIASEAIRTDLGESHAIVVVPASGVTAALQRMQRPPGTPVDLALAREIAAREGIKAVLDGEVTPLGRGYLVVVRLVAAENGDELAAFRESASDASELIPALDHVSRDVRAKIGESLRTVRATRPLEEVTTGSLEALRRYAAGVHAMDVEADYGKAITLLQQAIQRDSTFAMAYRKLGIAYGNGGYPATKADSALTEAFRYRDRLPDRERLMVEGSYYGSGRRYDRPKSVAAYEALLEIDPDNGGALNNLALQYTSRRDLARAESLYRRALTTPAAGAVAYGNLLSVLVSEGKLAAADSVARLERERFPEVWSHSLGRVPILYARGETDSLRLLLERNRSSDDMLTRLRALNYLSDLDAIQGRLHASVATLDEALAANAARGAQNPVWTHAYIVSSDDIWLRGKTEQGVRRLDSLVSAGVLSGGSREDRPYFSLAQLYAMAGRADRARAVLERYDADVRDSMVRRADEPELHTVRAAVALAEGDPLVALREIRASDSAPDGPATSCGPCVDAEMGLAFDRARRPDSAIARYEQFMAAPYYARGTRSVDGTWLAFVSRRLGEMYEERGDRAKAAAYYQKLVTLWKDADPELQPQVEEVKRRLARLMNLEHQQTG